MKTELLHILRTEKRAVSGQELCERFGVSRTAIWKAIGQLKEEGYEIESATNRGYELKSTPDRLTKHELESRLRDCTFGQTVLAFDRVSSTNQVLKEDMDNLPHGLLAIAEEQTMGKGRRGRSWQSPPGTGIWMSLLLRNMHDASRAPMVTIIAALAVREAMVEMMQAQDISDKGDGIACAGDRCPAGSETDVPENDRSGSNKHGNENSENGDSEDTDAAAGMIPEPFIKWPNDIVIDGKKVCGILTEMVTEVDYLHGIVVGIGINVHQAEFPPEISKTATSLYLATGRHFDRPELVERILRSFERKYEVFLQDQDLRNLRSEYNHVLVNAGEQIRVLDEKHSFCGTGVGIDNEGRLIVETENGRKAVRSGEVSVRGIYGYT